MEERTQLVSKFPPRVGCTGIALALLLSALLASADELSTPLQTSTSGDVSELIGTAVPPPPAGFHSVSEFASEIATRNLKLVEHKSLSRTVRAIRNIEFSRPDGVSLSLDLFSPKSIEGRLPGLILLHSGGWRDGTRQDFHSYAAAFAEQGFVAVTIDYRLAPDHPFPAAVLDVKNAIRWMRKNAGRYQIDPAHLGILGSSAGGHLALMAAYTSGTSSFAKGSEPVDGISDEVQAVVDIYGPTDLTVDPATVPPMVARCVTDFLGTSAAVGPELCRQASPLTYVSAASPPTLIIHGTLDDIVPIAQADVLAHRLAELRVPFVYDRIAGWPHAMDLTVPIQERCIWLSERFLKRAFQLSRNAEQKHP